MATAPSNPSLVSPANGAFVDVSSGVTFSAIYNPTDGANQENYIFRIKQPTDAAYQYWNGTALQSTITYVADTSAPGGTFGPTLSSADISNGNVYNWSMLSQESAGGLTSSFPADFTLIASATPTVTVTGPTGTASSSTPAVTWTNTLNSGAVQSYYSVIVETGAYSTTPGSGTLVWASGLVASASLSATVGNPVPAASCRAFVQLTQTGGQTTSWGYTTFTGPSGPSTPSVTATASTDGTTGCPRVTVTVSGASAGTLVVTRSDGLYVRGASPTNPTTYSSPTTVYDYEAVPGVSYTYAAVVTNGSGGASAAGTSASVSLTTTGWWELDPTNVGTAVNANPIEWSPVQIEQSTGHPVMGQNVMNVVASTVLNQDFTGTFELFIAAVYTGFEALLGSGKIVFISSPWGSTDSGYFRIGPTSGGMSTGTGSTVKNTKLMASTSSGPHRTVDVLAVAAPRPTV